MRILNKFNDYSLLPINFSECSYLTRIVDILQRELSDEYNLQIIYPNAKIFKNRVGKFNLAIHISNELFFDGSYYNCFDFVFRFYLTDKCDYKKIFPINIGYNSSGFKNLDLGFNPHINYANRKNELFFHGNKQVRKLFFKAINKYHQHFDIEWTSSFSDGLSIIDFRRKLSETKICLAPGGCSPESFRYTEAFASGCIVITDFISDAWYMKGSPSIYINNWKDLSQEYIEDILNYSDLGEYRERAILYYEQKLSPNANAYYILNIISSKS